MNLLTEEYDLETNLLLTDDAAMLDGTAVLYLLLPGDV